MARLSSVWRRWWVWVCVVVVVYLVGSWLLVPWMVEYSLTDLAREQLGLESQVESISFNPVTFEVTVDNARFLDRDRTVFRFDGLSVDFELFHSLFSWRYVLDFLEIRRPEVLLLRDTKGLNWKEIAGRIPGGGSVTEGTMSSLYLRQLRLREGAVRWRDSSGTPPVALRVDGVTGNVDDLRFPPSDTWPIRLEARAGEGRIKVEGSWRTRENQLSLDYDLREFPLTETAGYLSRSLRARLESGRLTSRGHINLDLAAVSMETSGEAQVTKLRLQTLTDTDIISWETMKLGEFDVTWPGKIARIRDISLEEPFLRLHIEKGYRTNIGEIVAQNNAGESKPEEIPVAETWDLSAGPIWVRNGGMNFRDENVPGGFQSRVHDVGGTVSTIQMGTTTPAQVNLSGRAERQAVLDVDGQFDLFGEPRMVDVTMEFRNIAMVPFTPYAIKFAGYRIDQGQLHLRLQYTLRGSQLSGNHNALLKQFRLGDRVNESPVLSLPVKLAVALLKDSNGVIELNIPVSGNINNPQFSFAKVIQSAISNILGNIVSSPFRFLAGLVGAQAEDLQQIHFRPAHAHIPTSERENVDRLRKALSLRPELRLAIRPAWSPADQKTMAREWVDRRLREAGGDPADLVGSRSRLETLYVQDFSHEQLDEVQARHRKDQENGSSTEINEEPYVREMYHQLVAQQDVPTSRLVELANRRAQNLRDALLGNGLSSDRFLILEVQTSDAENGRVPLPLSLRP